MPNPKLTIIIPTYNEPSHLWFTINCIKENLQDFSDIAEIIVANNYPERHKVFASLAKTGVQIVDVPQKSTSVVRNVPAAMAKGEILCFCDTHIIPSRGAFERAVTDLEADKSIGSLHGKTLLHGNDGFMHYRLSLEKNFGGCNAKIADDLGTGIRMIPASGHGFYFIRKSLFDKIGGYLDSQKSWGGEELFIELAVWMHDFYVMLDPLIYHYHLPQEFVRPNARNAQEFIVSNLASAYVLGGMEWLDKITPFYLSMGYGPIQPRLERVPEENQARRDKMLASAKLTLNDVIKFWEDVGLDYRDTYNGDNG